MKYKELISFEPINEVVKFDQLSNEDYRHSLVRNFVFSETYEKTFIPAICKNLDYTASYETFGMQIVGNESVVVHQVDFRLTPSKFFGKAVAMSRHVVSRCDIFDSNRL